MKNIFNLTQMKDNIFYYFLAAIYINFNNWENLFIESNHFGFELINYFIYNNYFMLFFNYFFGYNHYLFFV